MCLTWLHSVVEQKSSVRLVPGFVPTSDVDLCALMLQVWRRQETYIDQLEEQLAVLKREGEERAAQLIREGEERDAQLAREGEERDAQLAREGEERDAQLARDGEERDAQLTREGEERHKVETSRRENLLVMRLTAKEQEIQGG